MRLFIDGRGANGLPVVLLAAAVLSLELSAVREEYQPIRSYQYMPGIVIMQRSRVQ